MSSGTVQIADVVVPQIFNPYIQQFTTANSRLIQSGAVTPDAQLQADLAGGGLTFNSPSFKDLDNDADNVSTDNPATLSTPNKIESSTEIQVRMSRNNSWSSMDIAGDLIGADPMQAIANRVGNYWVRRLQAAFIATITGLFADNAAAPTATEHVQNDMTSDVSGASYVAGVTNITAGAFIDACATMGDSMDDLGLCMVHSIVYSRMLKNNLIEFVPDAVNPNAAAVPTYLGRQVIVSDSVPRSGAIFNTWIFGRGSVRSAIGAPKVPTEVSRVAAAGNGSGQEVLYNRVEWILHPVGNAYVGTAPNGGPSNASTTNNLAHADSWKRVFPERAQIKIARLITREY
jgi:hypothetical protein